LGNAQSSQDEVESFYDFWYKFDSWRTFEWMDKEDGEGHDSRDDKRYFEKKNKAERAKLKKEDNARLREIVDQALSLDPRIKLFKEAANKQRNDKRLEKEAAEKKAAEEAVAAAAAAETARIAAEEAEKAAREDGKKNKELLKRAVRKEKKNLKALIKDNNYFLPASQTPAPSRLRSSWSCWMLFWMVPRDWINSRLFARPLRRVSRTETLPRSSPPRLPRSLLKLIP